MHRLRDLRRYEDKNDDIGRADAPVNIDTTGIKVNAVVKKYRLDSTLLMTCVKGQRSDVIWKIGQTLKSAGASPDEIGAVILASPSFRSKHGTSVRALAGEVSRIMRKK